MTEEQGKSIKILERLNFFIIDLKSNKKVNEIVTEEGKFNLVKDIETVLNMLKEKDKEIEHQIEKRNNQKAELAILNEKQKEMNKLINTVKSYKGQMKKETKRIKSLEKEAQKYFEEIIKQDREMDLMAETIRKLTISLANYRGSYNEETFNFTGNIKDIRQYFERKATNDG